MERFDYEIGGIKYEQTELTWKKDKKLIALYNRVHSAAFKKEELRLKDLQPLLVKYNLLNRFFGIILRPKITFKYILLLKFIPYWMGIINLEDATNTQIAKIFEDFFLLNQKFGIKLKELGNALGLIASEAAKMPENQKQ